MKKAAIGKKAENLLLLKEAGFDVPEFFVIPPSDFLDLTELQQQINEIGGYPVAIRSSGVLEDLSDASFAGQYDTFLNVQTFTEACAKILGCRDSAKNVRVKEYLQKNSLKEQDAHVAVIVQRMINPKRAGVAFTMHPTRGKENLALIEWVDGLGEALVSGHATPHSIEIDLRQPAREAPLAEALIQIQDYFGRPQDVEWAVDQEHRLWILQSRDITKINFETQETLVLKDPQLSKKTYAPLAFEMVSRPLDGFAAEIANCLGVENIGSISEYRFGRFYINASKILKILSEVDLIRPEKLGQMLGVDFSREKKNPSRLTGIQKCVGLIRLGLFLLKQLLFSKTERLHLERKLAAFDLNDAFIDLELIHFRIRKLYFKAIFLNALVQGFVRRWLPWIKERDYALNSLPHRELARAILEMNANSHDDFLTRFGHHADDELDWLAPRWSEMGSEIIQRLEGMKSHTKAELKTSSRMRQILLLPLTFIPRITLREKECLKDLVTKSVAKVRRTVLAHQGDLGLYKNEQIKSKVLGFRNWSAPEVISHVPSADTFSHGALQGLGATEGVVEGRVRVIHSLSETEHLLKGEILVTRLTDPAWTPIFGKIPGLITEVGGVLSHAAIIAREYQIPAIVGLSDATRLLKTGDHVRIFGKQGIVERMEAL